MTNTEARKITVSVPTIKLRTLAALAAVALAVAGLTSGAFLLFGSDNPVAEVPAAANPAVSAPTYTPTVSEQISTWYTSGGQTKMDAVQRDLQAIGTSGGNFSVMSAHCLQLTVDTTAAYGYTPIPDAIAQGYYLQAMSLYNQSGNKCFTAISTKNGALIQQATADMNSGTQYILSLTNRINALKSGTAI
jgi:hypothetical protein